MAQTITLEGLRQQIVHSLYGKKFGFAPGNSSDSPDPELLTGLKGIREPVVTINGVSTASDQIPPYGIVLLTGTTDSTFQNPTNPIPGHTLRIFNMSQAVHTIQVSSNNTTGNTPAISFCAAGTSVANIVSSQGTVFSISPKGWAELTGLSTAKWYLQVNPGSAATTGSSVSTSTA